MAKNLIAMPPLTHIWFKPEPDPHPDTIGLKALFGPYEKELAFFEQFSQAWHVVSGGEPLTIEPPYLDEEMLEVVVLRNGKRSAFRVMRRILGRLPLGYITVVARQTFNALEWG